VTNAPKCRCPTCGHPILPKDPLAILVGTRRAVFDVIYAAGQAGIDREGIMARVWAGRDRTPESTSNVSVHVTAINKLIGYLRMRIVGSGRPKFYRVVSTADQRASRAVAHSINLVRRGVR